MIELIKAGVFDSSQIFRNMIKTPERIAEYYEIELYISGEGKTYINSKAYTHEKGNLIFSRPGYLRHSLNKFLCFYVHLNMDKDTEELMKKVEPMMKISNYASYKLCFTEIIRLFESGENHPLLLQSKLFELFDMILCDNELSRRNIGSNVAPEIIRKAIDFINENYSRHLVLKDIADSVNFSPIYFHNMFTSYVGKTPHDLLFEKRLEMAKVYLLTTDLSLGEIIDKCGFSSHSNFDYSFKKAFGITPSEFRKRKYQL